MDAGIYEFEMPIPLEVLEEVQETARKSDVLTFFDQSVDAYRAVTYRIEKARFATETFALLDSNCFKDILALYRKDRPLERRRQAAALCLFFHCADINLEPGFALHESRGKAIEELTLFRQIDNINPLDLVRIIKGEWDAIPSDRLFDMPIQVPNGNLDQTIRGELVTEIALLKLAELIRDNNTPSQRLEKFLRWCLDEFIFVREPVLLAFYQLTGNLPKPILKNIHSKDPQKRLSGVRNALWDLLLLREWRYKLDNQSTKNCLWLLCSRDATLSKLARKLVIVGDVCDEIEFRHRESMLIELWGQSTAGRINKLYQELTQQIDDLKREANRSSELDWQALLVLFRARLME